MSGLRRQRGNTLLVGLVMLVLLTLMAVSAINMSTAGIQVVGNAQFREEAIAAAQQGIENVISTTSFTLTAPAAQNIDINNDGTTDYSVSFSPAPSCQYYRPVNTGDSGVPKICFGSVGTALCYWTVWDITAVVNDATTGASATVHQGVRLIAGLNAALTYCGV